jgi:hypothetical protein
MTPRVARIIHPCPRSAYHSFENCRSLTDALQVTGEDNTLIKRKAYGNERERNENNALKHAVESIIAQEIIIKVVACGGNGRFVIGIGSLPAGPLLPSSMYAW